MRILFITSRFPGDLRRGDQLRAFHQLRQLSSRHSITLLAFDHVVGDAAVKAQLDACCERVIMQRTQPVAMLARLALGLFGRLPLQVAMYDRAALRTSLAQALDGASFDLVHVQMARLGSLVPHVGSVPCVVDLIDALSLNMARRSSIDRGPMRLLARIEAARLPAYERWLCGQASAVAVCAEPDRLAIGADLERLHRVENGVDLEQFPFQPGPREGGEVLFVGNLGYFPNVDAARWFAESVLPELTRRRPDARFRMAGARPAAVLGRLAARHPAVELLGPVPRVHPHLARAAVAVAPLRAGSGQQTKILEAMATGTPVVATSLAAAGLDVTAGEHLLVADGAQAFAAAVAHLLDDPHLATRLATNARRHVEQHYTWEGSARALERLWLGAVTGTPD